MVELQTVPAPLAAECGICGGRPRWDALEEAYLCWSCSKPITKSSKPRVRRAMSCDEIAKARELRTAGMGLKKIGRMLGFDKTTVHSKVRDIGVFNPRPAAVTEDEKNLFRELKSQGVSVVEIAKQYGRGEKTVYRMVRGVEVLAVVAPVEVPAVEVLAVVEPVEVPEVVTETVIQAPKLDCGSLSVGELLSDTGDWELLGTHLRGADGLLLLTVNDLELMAAQVRDWRRVARSLIG